MYGVLLLAMALSASSAWCAPKYPDREKIIRDARALLGTPLDMWGGGLGAYLGDSLLSDETTPDSAERKWFEVPKESQRADTWFHF